MSKRSNSGYFSPINKLLWSFAFLFLLFATSRAQDGFYYHPELNWRTFETEHFIIDYHDGTERTANLVAKIAEEVYPHVTGLYQYWPKSKTVLVIRDTDDYSNGGAYYYHNKIEIWAPNMDFLLRGTHNWLRDVVTHEFTHIISLRKSFKFGPNVLAGWFQVFGYEGERRKDVVRGFPNVMVSYPISGITIPGWFAEGVAQFQSPGGRYDYRDSHREMVLRDRVVSGNLLDLKQMGVFGKNSVGNESVYNQGFAFVRFLSRTFGDSVLRNIAHQASSPVTIDFDNVLKNVTGIPADSIYDMWKAHLQTTYGQRLTTVEAHLKTGDPIQDNGVGNVFPVFSPDGKKVAYLESMSDYMSVNALVVEDLETREKLRVAGPVSGSISWSPDGRYLTYAKVKNLAPNRNGFNEIFVYDLKRHRELQLTRLMRGINPDWSHDGKKLVFVVQSDGVNNLVTLTLDEFVWIKKKSLWHTRFYDLENHRIVTGIPAERRKNWQEYYRPLQFWGQDLQQVTFEKGGRQFFHPRWSPDDSYLIFDTSTENCRDIARIPSGGGDLEFVLNGKYDERYPSFDPATGELYFASDRTGIFNIYSYDFETGEIKPHTNVVGGAFMPTVNPRGDLVYSLYKNQGYKIYRIRKVNELPPAYLTYQENYESQIPVIHADDSHFASRPSKPYKRSFGPVFFMPRLLIDYGTIKPGFYVGSDELLDKMTFFGGGDVNKDFEYNLFALFEFRFIHPLIFFNFYNQSAKIEDHLSDPFYEAQSKFDVNFNLMEAELGLSQRLFDFVDTKLNFVYRFYRAKIGTFAYRELSTGQMYVSPPIRYTYLRGFATSISLKKDEVLPERDSNINPRVGYYAYFKYTHENENFLRDFATDRAVGLEEYDAYRYNQLELDVEKYLPVPYTKHHSLSLRFQGGYIDRRVDDFFNFFAGGLIGMKGYSYYSIEGRKMAIGTVNYRMPLVRNLNFQIFNWYLDKIYLGGFYQYGNAWNAAAPTLNNFKSDVGVQLRLETFSWYMFPTRIFFEAAYPLNEQLNRGITYNREWKFYAGVLFDFDLRFDKAMRKKRW